MNIENKSETDGLRTITWITYISFAVGVFTGGLAFIVGIIIAYLKRNEAIGTIYNSHLNYLIYTAWWMVFWTFLGSITIFFYVGIPILMIAGIWYVYRLVRGILRLADSKPVR